MNQVKKEAVKENRESQLKEALLGRGVSQEEEPESPGTPRIKPGVNARSANQIRQVVNLGSVLIVCSRNYWM